MDNTQDDEQFEIFGVFLKQKQKGMTLVAYTTMLGTSQVWSGDLHSFSITEKCSPYCPQMDSF